uniref:Uncharacterized protein n=1 Tax=Theropithecus gelada TaxID=9565 RepID=A0A8D2FEI7_THEGE
MPGTETAGIPQSTPIFPSLPCPLVVIYKHSRNQNKQAMLGKRGSTCVNKREVQLKGSHTLVILVSSSHDMERQVERSLEGCSKARGSECSGGLGALLMEAGPQGDNAGTRPSHLCTTR